MRHRIVRANWPWFGARHKLLALPGYEYSTLVEVLSGTTHGVGRAGAGPVGFDWEKAVGVPPRGGTTGHTPTRLAGLAGDGAGGADLRIGKKPWTSASGVAAELRTATGSALTDLGVTGASMAGGVGMTGGAEGFACTAALHEVRATWEARLAAVRDECGRLHGVLARTGRHFDEVDHQVADLAGDVRPGDVPHWTR